MVRHCVGCIRYDLKHCQLTGIKVRFPGPGCHAFTAREPRYERYNDADYQEWVKERKMCEQS